MNSSRTTKAAKTGKAGPKPAAAVEIPQLIEDFLSHLQVERRMSAHTLDAYRRDLAALAEWTSRLEDPDLLALHTEQLRAFVAAEHRRGLSPKSLQRRLSACRSFYTWLLRHGRIAATPTAGLRAPKAPRKLPQVLDADEAVRLVEVPTDAPLGLRDRLHVCLQLPGGPRISVGPPHPGGAAAQRRNNGQYYSYCCMKFCKLFIIKKWQIQMHTLNIAPPVSPAIKDPVIKRIYFAVAMLPQLHFLFGKH